MCMHGVCYRVAAPAPGAEQICGRGSVAMVGEMQDSIMKGFMARHKSNKQ
jgi:hypothetical protein